MVATHLEKIFYHYLMEQRELTNIVKPRFFESEDLKKVYELSTEFIERYGSSPTKQQLVENAKAKGWGDELSSDKLDLIFETNLKSYEAEWLRESAYAWIE